MCIATGIAMGTTAKGDSYGDSYRNSYGDSYVHSYSDSYVHSYSMGIAREIAIAMAGSYVDT